MELRGQEPTKECGSGSGALLSDCFFADFARVADDESRHLLWCLQRLEELGFRYGDMPAHNLLWDGCERSAADVSSRLAVIPMMQEARGLDAGPRLAERLTGLGDARSAAIVRRIAQEELAHVAVGVDWFLHICKRIGADPGASFRGHVAHHAVDGLRGPFDHAARAKAGLPRSWYDPEASAEQGHPPLRSYSQQDSVPSGGRARQLPRAGSAALAAEKRSLARKALRHQAALRTQSSLQMSQEARTRAKGQLSKVYERMALIVAMEENNVDP
eukprot:SM000014S00386  [mRNA]  locus=s14:990642:992916:- [translate_table: standard]